MRYDLPDIPPPKLITALRNYNLLPAIVFVPSRRKCDESATEVALDKTFRADVAKQAERQSLFDRHAVDNPEIKRHKHRNILVNAGIASHHAGHLPSWKLLVETMMSSGLLNAIFATSTVAAGVDFPARTVVVMNADTRGNDGWRSLQASELQQMTGRAGRRGKDNVGFIVLAPGKFQDPGKIADLLSSPADPLESKFRATYTNLLNLLDAFDNFPQVREIAERSFAFRDTAKRISGLERKLERIRKGLSEKLSFDGHEIPLETAIGFERLASVRARLTAKLPETRAEMLLRWLKENVREGRIVSKNKSGRGFLLVLNVFGDKVVAMRDDGRGSTISLSRIKRIYAKKYPLDESSIDKAFEDIHTGRNPILKEPKLSRKKEDPSEAAILIGGLMETLIPEGLTGDQREKAEAVLWGCAEDANRVESIGRDIRNLRSGIWVPFEQRARVLDYFGYLDFESQSVTEDGKWLADLRLDRPLLVGEALKEGIFEKIGKAEIAGFMAALAADPDRDYGNLNPSGKLLSVLTDFEEVIYDVSKVEWEYGVEPSDEINLSAAATAESWAQGSGWEGLVRNTRAEEGDLVRLLSRTGEALMQIARLRGSKPEAAEAAKETAEILLRDPIR
jgi:ATP-dependent RNA helicase HelY